MIRTTLRPLAFAGMTAFLAACGGTATEDTASGPTLPAEVAANAEETTEPAEPTGPQRNDRGNIEKQLGEEGGITDEATGGAVLTFAVDAIAIDQPCTSEYPEPAENGHFVVIDLRMATAPELADSSLGGWFSVSPYDFRVIGPDGLTVDELGTSAAYSSLPPRRRSRTTRCVRPSSTSARSPSTCRSPAGR